MKNFCSTALVLIATTFVFATIAFGQTGLPVRVTNRATDPVPVRVTNQADQTPFQIGLDVTFSPTGEPTYVPAGKTFVVEYVTARMRTFNAFGTAPCKLLSVSFDAGPTGGASLEPFAFNPIALGSALGISNEVQFSVINQPVKIFVAQNSSVGLSLQASPTCVTPLVQGRMVLTGYLINS